MPETEDKLRLSLMAYPFPEIKRVEEVFSTLKADAALLEEAKRRGFYMGHTKANQMFEASDSANQLVKGITEQLCLET